MSHGSTSVARTSDRLDEHPGTGRGKTIECTTQPPCAGGGQCMEGGTKHVTLRRFEPYRLSFVHESDSDSRDSFWLSSSLLAVLVPHSSMAASIVTDPSSQGATTRHAARRRGSDASKPSGITSLDFRWWMGSRRRCRRVRGGGRAVRHLATDAEDADCGASSGDRACRSSRQAWREGMRNSRQAWARCTGSDGDARGGEWQHQTAALSCTCRTRHRCSEGFASDNETKRRTGR